MSQLSKGKLEIWEMDELAAKESAIHNLHPLSKLIITFFYVIVVVSFSKYDLSGLIVMILYPILMFQMADIAVRQCFYKLRIVMPLVCAVGIVNPFLDHTPIMQIGNIVISGGMLSMVTLMLKGIFSLMASFLLIATTSIDAICAALRKIHIPDIMVTLLLLTYRYVGLMLEEVGVMYDAYMLRAPGQKGVHISAWGSFLGQLLLRSLDRGEELYNSMQLRGYCGEFYYADIPKFQKNSLVYILLCIVFFGLAREVNIAEVLGTILVK